MAVEHRGDGAVLEDLAEPLEVLVELEARGGVEDYLAAARRLGSGTVGPDAIAEGSSCGTSEIASVTISAAR